VRDESAFDGAAFLGLARRAKRDPYRLGLFARHFETDEEALALLPIAGGTIVLTNQRFLEFQTHLEVDGAWNVREFSGYTISRQLALSLIAGANHVAAVPRSPQSSLAVDDVLRIETSEGPMDFVLSRGPEAVVPSEDVDRMIGILRQRSRFRGPTA